MFLEEFKRRWNGVTNAVQRELLLEELVIRLAMEPTVPADFFDRPQLVELMEAARFAFPLQLMEVAAKLEAQRVADPSYVPTLEEAMRHPEFVAGMQEVR